MSEQSEERLVIKDLHKSFATPVLKGVNLSIKVGEVHALVGENGAGKSTLMNILSGLLTYDSGSLFFHDDAYTPKSPLDAFENGIAPATQELSVLETLSVSENITITDMPNKFGVISHAGQGGKARDLLDRVGLNDVDAHTPLSALSLGQQQLVEIAKAMYRGHNLLILDEPTAALTVQQADILHDLIRDLADGGCSVIYISHRLEDVLAVSDTVSVLRDGEVVFSGASKDMTVDSMILHMSGDVFLVSPGTRTIDSGPAVLNVAGITTDKLPHPLSFTCNKSEIVGLAGLAGSGRSELLHALFGLDKLCSGQIEFLKGQFVPIENPSKAVALGVGFVPEDRKTQGILKGQSVAMNMILSGLSKVSNSWGVINRNKQSQAVQSLIEKLAIKCHNQTQNIEYLSGGNQQKALIGRWLHCDSTLLLLDEPTRGVDVGAKRAIHDLLRELRDEGGTILFVSSEMEELMALSDRIFVLSAGKLVSVFDDGKWDQNSILADAFSEYTASQ